MRSTTVLSGLVALHAAVGAIAAGIPFQGPTITQAPELPQRRDTTTTTVSDTEPIFAMAPEDPWQCVTENITQYFDVPRPTGNVLTAMNSYGYDVAAPCRATATGIDRLSCTVSDLQSWCGFTTAAPSDVLSSYLTYATAAVSFLRSNSATISVLSTSCSVAWGHVGPIEKEWLRIAMAHGSCYLAAHPATNTGLTSTRPGMGGAISSTSTSTLTGSTLATTTSTSSAVAGRGQALEALAFMSAGLAVFAGAV